MASALVRPGDSIPYREATPPLPDRKFNVSILKSAAGSPISDSFGLKIKFRCVDVLNIKKISNYYLIPL